MPLAHGLQVHGDNFEVPSAQGKAQGKEILQYSGLENSMDCIVHGVTKSQTWMNAFHFFQKQI